MKVTNEQTLELFQLKIGDVIKSSDLKKYCEGIEFWVVSKSFLLDEIRLYPLNKEKENPFASGGVSLSLLIGLNFEKVNNKEKVVFVRDMKYDECYDLCMFEDKFQELKPFFFLCEELIALNEDDATMQDALNMLCDEFPQSTQLMKVFQDLINELSYYEPEQQSESELQPL